MVEHMNIALVESALRTRQPAADLLHHFDLGNQYTSATDESQLVDASIQMSLGRIGNCHDNAVAESFFGTVIAECVSSRFAIHALARTTIFEHIEVW